LYYFLYENINFPKSEAMGVSNILPKILASSGRPVDLRDFADGIITISQINNHNKNRDRTLAPDRKLLRPLRIGIDVNSWIYNAGYAFSELLGDPRHLTYYGRADLVQEQNQQETASSGGPSEEAIREYVVACTQYVMKRLHTLQETTNARLLVVLDGRSPPIKGKEVERRRQLTKEHNLVRQDPTVALGSPNAIQMANERRTTANKRAGPGPYLRLILDSVQEALRAESANGPCHESSYISLLVAPYEADAQLAYLAQQRYIDLIITEDSDLMAYGAPYILYKSLPCISNGIPAGILLQQSDMGALPLGSSHPTEDTEMPQIKACSSGHINLMDFTPVMMATLFVLLGCDYTVGEYKKLFGIGPDSAHKIVRTAFFNKQSADVSTLSVVWEEAYKQCYMADSLTPEFKVVYERTFMEALLMYRHPIVFDPLLKNCIHINQGVELGKNVVLAGDPELMEHRDYDELCRDSSRISSVVGELPPEEKAVGIAEGRIKWRIPESKTQERKRNREEEDESLFPPRTLLRPLSHFAADEKEVDDEEIDPNATRSEDVDHESPGARVTMELNRAIKMEVGQTDNDEKGKEVTESQHVDGVIDVGSSVARRLYPFPSTEKTPPKPNELRQPDDAESIHEQAESSPASEQQPMTQEGRDTTPPTTGSSSSRQRRGKREKIVSQVQIMGQFTDCENADNDITTLVQPAVANDEDDSDSTVSMSIGETK
jgi:5'-3' exonuclease